jgi:hypothetical protein
MKSQWGPPVTYREGAKEAARLGAGAAALVAGVTALFGVLAIFGFEILPGFSRISLVDSGLFAIVAWRTYKMSRAWAVVGLVMFVAGRVIAFYLSGVIAMSGIIGGLLLLLLFLNGVRGTFAYHKLSTQPRLSDST